MLSSGDIVDLDLGAPSGHEAGMQRPVVIVTAQRLLERAPNVVQVVPLTTTIRSFESEVRIEPTPMSGLHQPSAAQCQHVRSVAVGRIEGVRGQVDAVALTQIRDVLGLILDIPG